MSALSFSETMAGYLSFGERDYNAGFLAGRRDGIRCAFRLKITVEDVDRFTADARHEASASGVVECDALGGALGVDRGCFNLLVAAPDERHQRMLYSLPLRDPEGRPLLLHGFKLLERRRGSTPWSDSTTLFTTIYAGDEADEQQIVARGLLRLGVLDFARQLTTFRATAPTRRGRLGALARFDRLFVSGLRGVYAGSPVPEGNPDFPEDPRFDGRPEGEWHALAGRPGLERRILGLRAADGTLLTLHNIRGRRPPTRGPVLLAHGASVRASLFYGAPVRRTLVDALVDDGWDVWCQNWRGSIDLDPCSYTIDAVAALDHPPTVRAVLGHTGHDHLKAIVHCQGSTSFCLAAAAGLLPEVDTIVTSGVSLHVDVLPGSALKMRTLVPVGALFAPGLDPQWAIRSPALFASGYARWARLVRRECDSEVCAAANYAFGVGPDVLWRHANVDRPTHDWLAREWGYTPFSFFKQMSRCVRAGHLVTVDGRPELPADAVAQPVATDARFVLIAALHNHTFLPTSQRRTYEWLDAQAPGRHEFIALDGYGHLDPFFGRDADRDVHPAILAALDAR